MKKIIIVANWKMNPESLVEAKRLFDYVKRGIKGVKNAEVVVCPPFVFLGSLGANGAQDCFWENRGAFTGEVSPTMLKNLGVEYVIIGHSERRRYLRETDEMVNRKLRAAMAAGLKPILCIANAVQLRKSLRGISEKVIVAYEPVSAIGTGRPCSIEKARKMRKAINHKVVLYGGSINSENALDYVKKAGFQGLLIGGASLKADEFLKIVKNISQRG